MLLFSNKKKDSRGLSLIEASMVLALSAIVVSGVLYYYNNASSNRKLVDDAKTVQMVISTIRTLYENQKPGTKIDATAVAKSGNFTTALKSNGSLGIVMPTGEILNIIDGSAATGNRLYAIDFYTKDKNICSHLASVKYGTSHFATEVVGIKGNVTAVSALLAKPAVDRYLTVSTAAQKCSQGIDDDSEVRVYMAFKG